MELMVCKTKVGIARPESGSGRTTIPLAVMNFLDIEHGDTVKWMLTVEEGRKVVVFEKLK